jgi:hypothetical protein
MSVIKHYTIKPIIDPLTRVQVQKNFCLQTRMHPEPPAYKVQTRDGRMVARLLCIDGAAVDHALVSLAQNRIERLLDIKVHQRVA